MLSQHHLSLRRLSLSLVGLLGLSLSGCLNSSPTNTATAPTTPNNPVPTISALAPASAIAGAAAQTLTINGTGFLSTSTATYNGTAHTATFVSATSLTIPLTTADQATVGMYPVVVTSPTPGGGSSAAVNFAVNPVPNPAPTVTSIAPGVVLAGSGAQTITVTGTNFIKATTVTFAGTAITPTIVSGTSLTIALSAGNVATAGSFPIVVTNPTPGGGSSAAVNLTVNNPAPTVTSLSPAALAPGSPAQTLTVTGTNFSALSTVTYNGVAHAATIVSPTSLTIPLTTADLATAGNYAVVVTNPAPGGGSSTAISFTVSGLPTLSGTVTKGPSVGSIVTAYPVNADGSNGAAIGTATTDTNGTFKLILSTLPTGAVRLTAAGGNYISEFDNMSYTGTSSMSLLLDTAIVSTSGLSITPGSDFVSSYAAGLLLSKTAMAEPAAHATAEALMVSYIGLSKSAVIETLLPVFDKPSITSNPDGFTLGLFLGALATQGHTVSPSAPDELIALLSEDISDGLFDGKMGTTPIPLPSAPVAMIRMKDVVPDATTAFLSPTAGTSDMLLALGTYISSGSAILTPGITQPDVAALESSFFTGVTSCTCTPAASGLSASSSGATTTYSLAGRQYLIVAARQQGVVVIDITDPTLKTPPINAWPSISSTTFGGADVGGVVAITGLSGHPQVLAYAYQSKTIAVLNLSKLITGNPATDNPVDVLTSLTLKATAPVGFSGGSAYIAGGIPDTGRLGIWLDTADGYGLLSLSSLTTASSTAPVALTSLLPVDSTSSQEIAENMGGDITNNQLLGGNYRGLQLLDLAKSKSYYMPSSAISAVGTQFSSDLVDGNSVDSALRVGILTSEDTPTAVFLNLGSAVESDSTVAGTPNSFTAAKGGLVEVTLGASGGYYNSGPILSGSAVDKNSHLALFMAGYSNDFAVGKLQDPAAAAAAGTPWTGMTDWKYFTINSAKTAPLSSYNYATDPHSVGVVVNQTTGTPYGYLFDGSTDRGIVQIDMLNFLALTPAGPTGDAAHQPGVDPSTATATVGTKTGLVLQEYTWTNPTTPIPAVVKHTVTQEEFPNQPMRAPK
jgi:hypothetical protein